VKRKRRHSGVEGKKPTYLIDSSITFWLISPPPHPSSATLTPTGSHVTGRYDQHDLRHRCHDRWMGFGDPEQRSCARVTPEIAWPKFTTRLRAVQIKKARPGAKYQTVSVRHRATTTRTTVKVWYVSCDINHASAKWDPRHQSRGVSRH
jgi:hypothetical protein